jgi:phosphoglycerate dehydrogenase-like enzyme
LIQTVVLVTFDASPGQRQEIEQALEGLGEVSFLPDLGEEERGDALRSARVLFSWSLRRELTEGEMADLDGITPHGRGRLLQLLSAGVNQVPFDRLPESLIVAGNVGAYAEPMAEHAVAMALALAKRLPQKHQELVEGHFYQGPPSLRIEGMVCGILGFGGIGSAVARRLRPLGVRIHAVNSTGKVNEEVEFAGTLTDLDVVLAAADLVVIALPLTKATRGLIGARELELMKPEAILVNVARGATVDEEALFRHLKATPGFMAGIDAWWIEPFSDGEFRTNFPFFELRNVLGSPHNSAIVPGILDEAAGHGARNVARFLRGEQVRGVVRREDYEG